jgi:hypothetical protein
VTLTAPETFNDYPFKLWEIHANNEYNGSYRREINVTLDSDYTAIAVYKKPEIYFSPTYFNFGGISDGVCTPAQEFLIGNRGGGSLDWVISDDLPSWLTVTPGSGTCAGSGSDFCNGCSGYLQAG